MLSGAVTSNPDEALKLAESAILTASLATEAPSPAEIVIFSTLYDIASTAKVESYPALSAWFSKVVCSEWAKNGIEKVTASTTVKPVKPSKGAAKASKVKEGIEMKIPKLGEEMSVFPQIAHKFDT